MEEASHEIKVENVDDGKIEKEQEENKQNDRFQALLEFQRQNQQNLLNQGQDDRNHKSKSELIEGTMSITSSVEDFTSNFVGGLFDNFS